MFRSKPPEGLTAMQPGAKPLAVGQRVKCWGVVGEGPRMGRIVARGASKDCWVIRLEYEDRTANVTRHEDSLEAMW